MLDILPLLEKSGALRRGHFQLSSGRHSADYVQCALLLERPSRARAVGEALAERFRGIAVDSVVAPALGGLLIGYEVASSLDLPFRFAERKEGVMALRRGFRFLSGERVLLIEDVITTGRSTRETIAVVEQEGAQVVAVGSIIDRTGPVPVFDEPFRSLLGLTLETHSPEECPLCAGGDRPDSPGSRASC